MSSPYHAKYYAYELTRRWSADNPEKLSGALINAQVELNPHQIDAALFAFQSPLSKGAILADEVGLGKTIEAGLVISQKWAERKRRILIITPANLRKQWYQELQEKFFLKSLIFDAKSYNEHKKNGDRPFERDQIIICSYHFARNKAQDVSDIPWDLVVIDEAHRLRNVYKKSNVIANSIKNSLISAPKVLLTATPLQNSLLELYGLVSFIDEHCFGDLKSFREQFGNLNDPEVFQYLKARLEPICKRTLRKQVLAYVKFTERKALVESFTPNDDEMELYNLVSEYLRRPNLQALPSGQRSLMTLILRKLLASSTFAIKGALDTMAARLKTRLNNKTYGNKLEETLEEDFEAFDEIIDEWEEESSNKEEQPLTPEQKEALETEIKDLEVFSELAMSITNNAKGGALLHALRRAFTEAGQSKAAEKAIIFTESRRTQNYLVKLLSASPWKDDIVLFNGTNDDNQSRKIYQEWIKRHKGTDKITGSRSADIRSALVDYFREDAKIMIATEAASEGINLQFCSLVVNYDLPWNPQRIEQRIGRCHRYGQKHDVVVVNFRNEKNDADILVYELLNEKFKLFEGLFGVSDEVLGAIESGVDFEKRIANIYQQCRLPEEIKAAFEQLQEELSAQISETINKARRTLLENFDEDVTERLILTKKQSEDSLNRYESMLMQLTRHELRDYAEFTDEGSFELIKSPIGEKAPLGRYELPRRTDEAHIYRLNHELAEHVLNNARNRDLPPAEIVFDYDKYEANISIIREMKGQSGSICLTLYSIESLSQVETYLIFAGVKDDGLELDDEHIEKIFKIPAREVLPLSAPIKSNILSEQTLSRKNKIIETISQRNLEFYEHESRKLDAWADDQKNTLELELKEYDRQIKETRRASSAATTLEEKLDAQKRLKALELERSRHRRSLFEAQDAIDLRRAELIEDIEKRLQQNIESKELFSIRWRIV